MARPLAPYNCFGEYADVESGLIYLRARMYDPSTGRFINEDPIRDGLNWYVYCENNPVMFVDPWGLAVTQWDKEHCTKEELRILKRNTEAWANGNEQERVKISYSSRQIRKKYLSDGEVLLDNGYVQQTRNESVNVSGLNGRLNVNVDIGYKRTYTEKITYIQLTKVNMSINKDSNVVVDEASITFGQTGIRSGTYRHSDRIIGNNYTIFPTWNRVIDDGGVHTIIGATVTMNVRVLNESHRVEVTNNVYEQFATVDHKYYDISEIDLFDVLTEGLQRGER